MDLCGECLKLDWSNKERYSSKDRYYCKERYRYVEPTNRACSYFSYNKGLNQKSNNGSYTPSGCYITTIVCDILGYPDNCELLTLLRNFRDNTLKYDPNYLSILLEYDIIGPTISKRIKAEKNHYGLALGLLNHFLIPVANYIKSGDVESAVEAYTNMVNYLRDDFELPNYFINVNHDIDYETLGKGRIRDLKTSEI